MIIEVNINKKYVFVFVFVFLTLIFVIFVNAVAPGGQVPFGGHDISEISPPSNCNAGDVLKKTSTGWTCVAYGGGWGNPTITRYINANANEFTGYDLWGRPYDDIISNNQIIGPHDVCFIQKITEGESNDRDGFFLFKLSDGKYKYQERELVDNQAVFECLDWN